jgi:hypothetical protein
MKPFLRVVAALVLIGGSLGFLGDGLSEESSLPGPILGPRMMLLGVCLSLGAILLWPLAKAPFRRSLEATRLDRCFPFAPHGESWDEPAPSKGDGWEEAALGPGQVPQWRQGHEEAPSRWYEWSDIPAAVGAEEVLA